MKADYQIKPLIVNEKTLKYNDENCKLYTVDFDLLIKNSKYFYDKRKQYENSSQISIEKQIFDVDNQTLQSFVSCCQNEPFQIDDSNVYQLHCLSFIYQVSRLTELTTTYMKEHNKRLLLKTITFLNQYPTINDSIFNIDIHNEEDAVASNLFEFIEEEDFFSFPTHFHYKILQKFFDQTDQILLSSANKELIHRFLFTCLEKHGKEASVLFSLINYENEDDQFINTILYLDEEKFDFNMIDSRILFQIVMKQKDSINFLKKKIYQFENEKEHHKYFEIGDKTDGMVSFLASNQNKYDPDFVASVSSNDIYNLICPEDENKNIFCFRYVHIKEPSSLSIELEKEVFISRIVFYTPPDKYPKSVSCKIGEIFLINDFKFESKKCQEIILEKPTKIKSLQFIIHDINDGEVHFSRINRIELFTPENTAVFESLLQESKDHDRHRCGVILIASHYDTNYFYLKNDSKHWITTNNKPGSWLQIELTKGYAILTGFRFRKTKNHLTLHYKIIATDDKNKEERTWKTLIDVKNENEINVTRKFNELSPRVKFIRLVQTGKNIKNDELKLKHFELFGYYFDGPIP